MRAVHQIGASTGVRRPRTDDRGEVAANTVVCVAMLSLFFLVVEFALIFAAQQTARSAARHALDTARLERGTATDGQHAAEQFLEQTNALHDPDVTVDRTTETVTVVVTGNASGPVPWLDPGVTVTLTAPVERVVG